jgi:signal transduction histidine kinase
MPTVRALLSRLPVPLLDIALAAAVAAVSSVMDATEPHGHDVTALVVWDLALAAPLVLRRRRRALAAATVALVCLVQWLADYPTHGDLFVLITLYTLGVHERRRFVLVIAAGVAELGILLAVARWSPGGDPWLTATTYTGTAAASLLLGVYVRTRRDYLASVLDRAEAAERDQDLRATIAVDAERARIAREMHDLVSHSVSVMITLSDAAGAVDDPEAARRTVSQVAEIGRQTLSEMQRVLGLLREDRSPEFSPLPGIAQLPDLVAMIRAAGISTQLSVTGELHALSEVAQLAVYRLVQESLTNVLKHGRNVTAVTVRIRCDADHVTLRVHDDGEEAAGPHDLRGHGIVGMQERVAVFDGRLFAGPAEGGGWAVVAEWRADPADTALIPRPVSGARP